MLDPEAWKADIRCSCEPASAATPDPELGKTLQLLETVLKNEQLVRGSVADQRILSADALP